jgi:hypothetical protein
MNFRLSALSAVISTPSVDNRSTLLHYLVKHIQRSTPDSSRFYEDLPTVTQASRLDSLAIINELAAIRALLQTQHDILRSFAPCGPQDRFVTVMNEFFTVKAPV